MYSDISSMYRDQTAEAFARTLSSKLLTSVHQQHSQQQQQQMKNNKSTQCSDNSITMKLKHVAKNGSNRTKLDQKEFIHKLMTAITIPAATATTTTDTTVSCNLFASLGKPLESKWNTNRFNSEVMVQFTGKLSLTESQDISLPMLHFPNNGNRFYIDDQQEQIVNGQIDTYFAVDVDVAVVDKADVLTINGNCWSSEEITNRLCTLEVPKMIITETSETSAERHQHEILKMFNNKAENVAMLTLNREKNNVVGNGDGDCDEFGSIHLDDEDGLMPKLRRSSSLKSGKAAPGNPSQKKIVRFADVLGLDLANIKIFLDEIPTIPKSAYKDLQAIDITKPVSSQTKILERSFIPMFQQPGGSTQFLDIVVEQQVCLEYATIIDNIYQTISGCIRVHNLDFHKSVYIRYTIDDWKTYTELQSKYVPNSSDGLSDKFSFMLYGNSLRMGQRLEFAICYNCKGQQFWDNNFGENYCFQTSPFTKITADISPRRVQRMY